MSVFKEFSVERDRETEGDRWRQRETENMNETRTRRASSKLMKSNKITKFARDSSTSTGMRIDKADYLLTKKNTICHYICKCRGMTKVKLFCFQETYAFKKILHFIFLN